MSQPPYGSGWPPQPGGQPGWGGQQPPQPPYQPPQPTQPLYPNPTQPLPPYQPPPPPPGQWGGPPAGPPPGPPPGPPYPPGPPGPPWGQPPRRNTAMIVAIAIVALLAIGGGVTGLILATSGKKKHDTQPTTTGAPTNGTSRPDFPSTGGSGPPTGATDLPTGGTDFPTGGTDFPTGGTDFPTGSPTTEGGGSAEQDEIASTAQTVLHALGATQPSTFCPLVDPADLKRLLKDKHLKDCSDVELNESYRDDYRHFTVTDPKAIKVTDDIAIIPPTAVLPSDFGGVELRQDVDGKWKYRFYTT